MRPARPSPRPTQGPGLDHLGISGFSKRFFGVPASFIEGTTCEDIVIMIEAAAAGCVDSKEIPRCCTDVNGQRVPLKDSGLAKGALIVP